MNCPAVWLAWIWTQVIGNFSAGSEPGPEVAEAYKFTPIYNVWTQGAGRPLSRRRHEEA